MNDIEQLKALIEKDYSEVIRVSIDVPRHIYGEWWLDIKVGSEKLEIAWREDYGFGFFDEEASFGSRPTYIIEGPQAAYSELMRILMKNTANAINLLYPHLMKSFEAVAG